MSAQLNGYWEPINARSDSISAYLGSDDEDHVGESRRLEIIVDPKTPYSILGSFLIVFVLASGIFFATMLIAFLEVHTVVETLQLPQGHQVFSDLQRIENVATLVFIAICLGFAILAIWGRFFFFGRDADTRQNFSIIGI
ncbi:MAG: hypothetical protein ACR2QZ_12260 [Woeseiaceae bacterium]